MNLRKKTLFVMTAVLCTAMGALSGQTTYDLNFQGILTDIQGNSISNEPFDISVQLNSASGEQVLFEFSSSTNTDAQGWFGFPIRQFSNFILKDGRISETVILRMEFKPNEQTRWLKNGDDFMVTYTVEPASNPDSDGIKIIRMEGSELVSHTENHLYAFKDQYPFAYLTGGFIITDQPPVEEQLIADLKAWVVPENEDEEGAASRGVKGGFPAGGYYKKN